MGTMFYIPLIRQFTVGDNYTDLFTLLARAYHQGTLVTLLSVHVPRSPNVCRPKN